MEFLLGDIEEGSEEARACVVIQTAIGPSAASS
jgi:hypothetical protein